LYPKNESLIAHTHKTAKNTSVTLNLLSTDHGFPSASAASTSSPKKVRAHLKPHHAAGAVLRALQMRSGKCQCLSTPSRTATRGCRTDFSQVGIEFVRREASRIVVVGSDCRSVEVMGVDLESTGDGGRK
jgi:hypothetical protein